LLAWYAAVRRDLPWRRTTDPYAILVSEVMLQQTQVSRVVPRYEAWLQRWPAAGDLAGARRSEVLRAWVGLGYNRRAVALHEACKIVAAHGWPDDLTDLPGVGPYTAAAVGSFAFGRDVVALDTNVSRVLERFGPGLEPTAGGAAAFNQAAMELGALVCRARRADCERCPLAESCSSRPPTGAPAPSGGRVRPPGLRFEETNRWVRGQVVQALAAGRTPDEQIPADRLRQAVEGLERDGIVERVGAQIRLAG
jgi:A/G-specific adenine glycosylase